MRLKTCIYFTSIFDCWATSTDLDSACRRLCDIHLPACPDTRCDSQGNCEAIMWSDATRTTLVAVSDFTFVPAEAVAVTCQSALEASTEEGPPLKRARQESSPANAEVGLMPPYSDPDSVRLRGQSDRHPGAEVDSEEEVFLGRAPVRIIPPDPVATLDPREVHESEVLDPTSTAADSNHEGEVGEIIFDSDSGNYFYLDDRVNSPWSDDPQEESYDMDDSSPQDDGNDEVDHWDWFPDSDHENHQINAEIQEVDRNHQDDSSHSSRQSVLRAPDIHSAAAFGLFFGLFMRLGTNTATIIPAHIEDFEFGERLDILEDDERWRGLIKGDDVRTIVRTATNFMASESFLSDLEQFPFTEVGRDVFETHSSALRALWDELKPYFDVNAYRPRDNGSMQTLSLQELISNCKGIRRWAHAIAAATAVVVNQPVGNERWTELMEYHIEHISLYGGFLKIIGKSRDDVLDDSVRAALGFWSDDDEVTTTTTADHRTEDGPSDGDAGQSQVDAEQASLEDATMESEMRGLTVPLHISIECKMCRLLAGKRRPSTMSGFGHALASVINDPSTKDQTRLERVKAHAIKFLHTLTTKMVDVSDLDMFCESDDATVVFEFVFEHARNDPFWTFTENASLLDFAYLCLFDLPREVRQHMVPDLLFSVYPPSHEIPVDPVLKIDQNLIGIAFLDQAMNALSTLRKADFLGKGLRVSFTRSPAEGEGTVADFVTRALEEAIAVENGLFEFTDERGIILRPRKLRADGEQRRNLIMTGRLIGLSIQQGKSPNVTLSLGCIAHLRTPVESLPWDDLNMLEEFLLHEDPQKHQSLVNLRDGLGAMEGFKFDNTVTGDPDDTLGAENLDQYILIKLREFVLDSVREEMGLVLRGVYDILPFPQLAWLTVSELAWLFAGNREINRKALRESARVKIDSKVYDFNDAIPDEPKEIEWFWDIISEVTEVEIRDFMQFVSGGKQEPIQGFAGPKGNSKWLQILMDPTIEQDRLPRAQVCFRQIRLPNYTEKEVMKQRLTCAWRNCGSMDRL